jgi:hypothetical protein
MYSQQAPAPVYQEQLPAPSPAISGPGASALAVQDGTCGGHSYLLIAVVLCWAWSGVMYDVPQRVTLCPAIYRWKQGDRACLFPGVLMPAALSPVSSQSRGTAADQSFCLHQTWLSTKQDRNMQGWRTHEM